jgi:protein-tyrosine phosphatase
VDQAARQHGQLAAAADSADGDAADGDAADRRRIAVAGTYNLRDLGGYPASGGRSTRWRTLLRSDALHLAGPAGATVLAGYGLRTVIDLRTPAEADLAPSAATGFAPSTVQVSLLGEHLDQMPESLTAIYRYVITERGAAVGAAVQALCAAGSVPALVHCSAGKDRTGIVIGLVLAVLGVPDEVIAADYALSGRYLNPRTTAAIGQLQASSGLTELRAELLASPPELMLETLGWVRDGFGSAAGYLTAHGVRPAELDALRASLTE